MNKEFIGLWEEHKEDLREELKYNQNTDTIDEYNDLVKLLIKHVINKGRNEFDIENITVIDNGDYQGSQLFLIPEESYQPSANEYLVTWHDYGSCSGCDTLLSIVENCDKLFNKQAVDDLMYLCLHLVQKLKYIYQKEEVT